MAKVLHIDSEMCTLSTSKTGAAPDSGLSCYDAAFVSRGATIRRTRQSPMRKVTAVIIAVLAIVAGGSTADVADWGDPSVLGRNNEAPQASFVSYPDRV